MIGLIRRVAEGQFSRFGADSQGMSSYSPVETMSAPDAAADALPRGSLGHSWAERFRDALESADLNRALDAYEDAPSWEDRWFCLEVASNASVSGELLDSWCVGWPDHVLPYLTRGATRARVGDPEAIADFDRASDLDAASPLPWGQRVVLARAVGAPTSTSASALAKMMPLAGLYEPHVDYLLGLGEGAAASSANMVEFAENVCHVVPAGSPLAAVMPLAAIRSMMVDVPDDHLTYLKDLGLFDAVLMAAGQSVFHPDFDGQSAVPSIKAMNAFAVALSILAQDDLALILVNRLGNTFTDWPLCLLGQPDLHTWRELRERLMAKSEAVALANGRA